MGCHNIAAADFSQGVLKFRDLTEKDLIILHSHRRQNCQEGPVCGFKVALRLVRGLSFCEIWSDKVKYFPLHKRKMTEIRGKKRI